MTSSPDKTCLAGQIVGPDSNNGNACPSRNRMDRYRLLWREERSFWNSVDRDRLPLLRG